jgi:hypothetical protein
LTEGTNFPIIEKGRVFILPLSLRLLSFGKVRHREKLPAHKIKNSKIFSGEKKDEKNLSTQKESKKEGTRF